MRIVPLVFLVAAAGAASLVAAPTSRPSSLLASGPVNLPGLQISPASRQVVVSAKVALQKGLLEFLLCRQGTKDYESVLATAVPPSALHAALLAIGLSPGRPGHWANPGGDGSAFVPPAGPMVQVQVRWKDKQGATQTADASDWLLSNKNNRPAEGMNWVFAGSEVLDDGRYLGDVEGDLISVSNFPSSVLDVPFPSTDQNALLEFSANSQAIPAVGTDVDVIITAAPGAQSAPVARLFFRVDNFGRVEMDAEPVALEAIPQAVRRFLAQHAQASAEVSIDARALVYDRQQIEEVLRRSGLAEVRFRVVNLPGEMLPRTTMEAAKALAGWREQFSKAEEMLIDPARDASSMLQTLQRQQAELAQLSAVWGEYGRRLQKMVAQYKQQNASTSAPAATSKAAE